MKQTKFDKKLALRKHGTPRKKEAECLPSELRAGQEYAFLTDGQRLFWLKDAIPLVETDRTRESSPLASIVILDATYFMINNRRTYTAGTYVIKEVYGRDKDEKSS